MRISLSRGTELFYRKDREPVEIYPRFLIDETLIDSPGAPCLGKGPTLLEQLKRKPDSTICLWRTYALGDVLILTPIINWLQEEYPECKIYVATSGWLLGLFKYWDGVTAVEKKRILGVDYDVGYYLDGIVEKDHTPSDARFKHRLDLYCDFLGIPVPKDPIFSLPYSDKEKVWAEAIIGELRKDEKPIIVMQAFGSTTIKRFSLSKTIRIASALSERFRIILVHNYREPVDAGDAVNMTGMTDPHQLAALIELSDVVVTMDSGILWVAHCTSTPIVALLGPTREQERLTYHPSYVVINLSKMVGCEPCFEMATRCLGAFDCMNLSDEEKIIEEIESGIKRLTCS